MSDGVCDRHNKAFWRHF